MRTILLYVFLYSHFKFEFIKSEGQQNRKIKYL